MNVVAFAGIFSKPFISLKKKLRCDTGTNRENEKKI